MFKKLTVDSVLSQFNKAVTDLEKVEAQQAAEAVGLGAKINELKAQRDEAVAEADRARSVREKIKALLV
jgi:hypothetical protein